MLVELAVCVATVTLALTFWHPLVVIVAMIVIATRQHAQFILFHDAVHGHVHSDRRVNDLVVNAIVGVPQLVPVQVYRRLHLAHHAKLGTISDPERLLLYRGQPWRYRPLPTGPLLRQLLGDLLLVNNVKTLYWFGHERRDPRSLLVLPEARIPPELWALVAAWGGLAVLGLAVDAGTFARFALLWFVPLLTLTQLIQKVRSFAEHGPNDGVDLTYSWRPGRLGRLVLWPYHINYHREHHAEPRVPWHELPAAFPDADLRPGRDLIDLLWQRGA